MKHIKAYRPSTNSICEGQVLSEPYTYNKARVIVQEMTDALIIQLVDKGLATDSIPLDIGYDREILSDGKYSGDIHMDHYRRAVPKPAHGSNKLDSPTSLTSKLMPAVLELYKWNYIIFIISTLDISFYLYTTDLKISTKKFYF